MSKGLTNLVIFAAGSILGSVATWYLVKTKYEQRADEEIASVKEALSHRFEDLVDEKAEEPTKAEVEEYNTRVKETGYFNYSNRKDVVLEKERPYVISPDEFGEIEEYETRSLVYYSDKILTDDDNNIIDDVEDVVGCDSLNHFGEYEDDSVFVRNDHLMIDYEILLDQRRYFQSIGDALYPGDDE